MTTPAARVLVVEDEADIRRFVRLTLASEGHEVFDADSVQRGLIEAGTRRPDLLVVDLGLPDGDGIDLIRDLRTWSAVPVIVLSARAAPRPTRLPRWMPAPTTTSSNPLAPVN